MDLSASPRDRRQAIFDQLEQAGRVTVANLASHFGVSEMTIRRDLEALERRGLIRRVHGGAVSAVSLSYEPPFELRAERNVEGKQRIGKAAAGLIDDGETIVLDVGSTTLHVAESLKGKRTLTVLTPSLRIAEVLAGTPGIRLMLTGGVVRPGEFSLIGDAAVRAFDDFVFDTVVLGVGGLHPEAGATEYNLDDAAVKIRALSAATRCIVVADRSKLGKVAFAKVCPLSRIDVVVTDAAPEDPEVRFLHETDIEVVFA